MNEYERVIYSFFDMAGDIGGFIEAIYIFFVITIGTYANRMYFASVIQDIFKVRLDQTHGQKITDLVKAKVLAKKLRLSFKRKTMDDAQLRNQLLALSQMPAVVEEEEDSPVPQISVED